MHRKSSETGPVLRKALTEWLQRAVSDLMSIERSIFLSRCKVSTTVNLPRAGQVDGKIRYKHTGGRCSCCKPLPP